MKNFEIETVDNLYIYSAFINGQFKITVSENKLSMKDLIERFKEL